MIQDDGVIDRAARIIEDFSAQPTEEDRQLVRALLREVWTHGALSQSRDQLQHLRSMIAEKKPA